MNLAENTKIVFFGTPEFALPSLGALINSGYAVAATVTNPDERVGRKQILTPPPVKIFAGKHGIPVLQPERLNFGTFKFNLPPADIYVVAAYGKIIPKEILDIPKFGALNIHPSLLPRWRGPSPIQATILAGDIETGVTIIQMDEGIDHGPIIAQCKSQIVKRKMTYPELHDELSQLGAELLIETLPKWIRAEITPVPQDDLQATYSKILTKDSGRIDWSQPAEEIERMVRAFTPWPGAWTTWPSTDRIYRLRIEAAEISLEEANSGMPGYVFSTSRHPLLVKTGQKSLAIRRLTLEGRRTVDDKSFLRGHPGLIGSSFI